MKKRIMSIIIAITMCMTCAFIVPATTHYFDASAASKYKKVKMTTYKKYKKAYKAQPGYIKTISNQKTEIENMSKTIKEKKQQVSWLWSTLEDFGYYYNYDTHKWEATEDTTSENPLNWAELQETTGIIPIMEEQTGLNIDNVQIVDEWKAWVCYYVEADGDLYTITMQRGVVDVCQILN